MPKILIDSNHLSKQENAGELKLLQITYITWFLIIFCTLSNSLKYID